MTDFLKKVVTKRSLLGTLLLTILIGEPTVGMATGIFTLPGIIIFFFLYLTLFHLFESLISKYKLVVYQVILLTFAIYSVLVTGLLHKELTEFITQPGPITALIRIQASFFVAFAFYLLNKIFPRSDAAVLSIKQSVIFFTVFVLIMSLTGAWGIPAMIVAFTMVPVLSSGFSIAAILAIFIALTIHPKLTVYKSKKMIFLILFYCAMGAIPSLVTFMILLITMIFGGIYLLMSRSIRNYPL